jgi:hypothetical protein
MTARKELLVRPLTGAHFRRFMRVVLAFRVAERRSFALLIALMVATVPTSGAMARTRDRGQLGPGRRHE